MSAQAELNLDKAAVPSRPACTKLLNGDTAVLATESAVNGSIIATLPSKLDYDFLDAFLALLLPDLGHPAFMSA